ncbi:glycoside hydrolase family 28 protein [Rathayibacter toxicus]|uniref:Polygalacturonase n=1 Tax=Rathayibacter toxicus TaxID=145458 RepID=A0A2S5Y5I5_9MICO|nr:glycosyl hydrolase family 28 protein [Rathayibacter toxicus]PPH21860.1 polygalacturonase [Rathayibacter toxicus]PPH56291.1 polygalacturonase [Rathayibacter toxicus]PPH58387.1 polygalacturonase [Rathayibacter toxicus]PPH86133.1 polygalacturonase [Rathayibacter toxicus]PPI14018.1 polygalacturonase [Rathayibacter toxicus]
MRVKPPVFFVIVASLAAYFFAPFSGALPLDATSAPEVVGDRRQVVEPSAPAITCVTVTAQLSMPNGTASAAQESAPPDTARIQEALDSPACVQADAQSVAVRLSAEGAHASFLSGPLIVHKGEVLLLDSTVTVYASRNPADYQVAGNPSCGSIAATGKGCEPLISVTGSHSGVESGAAPDGSQGRIDGRGGMPMLGSNQSWWQLSQAARNVGEQNVPRLIQAIRADDVTLHDIDLVNSPGFHVSYRDGDGLTAWGVRIYTPATARNTDGIDPAGATDVTIANSWIMDGDDGVAIKAASAPSSHISILRSHFFGTHGISIGSETTAGVSDVLVADNTVTGTDALGNVSAWSVGIRIKSSPKAGGVVTNVLYRNICIDAVKAPLEFDPRYAGGQGATTPWLTNIAVNGLWATHSLPGAVSTLRGTDEVHRLELRLENVSVNAKKVEMAFANVKAFNVQFGGSPVASTDPAAQQSEGAQAAAPPPCTVPSYPQLSIPR